MSLFTIPNHITLWLGNSASKLVATADVSAFFCMDPKHQSAAAVSSLVKLKQLMHWMPFYFHAISVMSF